MTSLAALAAMGGFCAVAQTTLTLNSDDFTAPQWTKIQRLAAAEASPKAPYSINMTVNGDPSSRMGFAWFTNSGVVDGAVQLVKKPSASEADFTTPDMEIPAKAAEVKNLNYSIANNYLDGVNPNEKRSYVSHKVVADNLEAGTTYCFRVGTAGAWSEIGSFTTASSMPDTPYKFIYITDTQAQNDAMFNVSQKTVHTALATVPDASFILCNGDLVETSGSSNSEWEYEQWFSTMQDVWLKKPLVVAQGNHDTSSNSNFAWHFNTDRTYNETAAIKTAMDGTVYSFVWGDVLYMVINYEDWKKEGYFDSLAAWMRREVEAHKDVKWRVACYHKNMFTGSRSHQDDNDGKQVRNNMLKVFDELGIDIALQGHDHIYEVIGPVRNSSKTLISDAVEEVEIVSGGGDRENMTGKSGGVFDVTEGTLYFLNNSAGKKKYEPRDESQMEASYSAHEVENYWGLFSGKFGQTGEPTFSEVEVSDAGFSITTYTVDDNGIPTVFDSFKVIKNSESTIIKSVTSDENDSCFEIADGSISYEGASGIYLYSVDGILLASAPASAVSTKDIIPGCYIVKATVGASVKSKVVKL